MPDPRGPCTLPHRPQVLDGSNSLIPWETSNYLIMIYEALEAVFERLCFLEQQESSAALDAPGAASFTPALYDYGSFTFETISVANSVPLTALHATLYYVNEIKSALRATTAGAINDSDNPAVVTVAISGNDVSDPELTFSEGDYILINDPAVDGSDRSYELCQLTDINGSAWTLTRGILSAPLHVHLSGVTLFKVQVKHFEEAYDTPQASIDRIDVTWPSALVAACSLQPESAGGLGPVTSAILFPADSADATQLPPSPGYRTLAGDSLPLPDLAGSGAVSTGTLRTSYPIYLPDSSSIRCIYAGVKDAPTGADLVLMVRYRPPGGVFTDLEEITIPDGTDESFSASNIPAQRRMPYGQDWPPIQIPQGSRVDYTLTQVGSGDAGSGLCVYIET